MSCVENDDLLSSGDEDGLMLSSCRFKRMARLLGGEETAVVVVDEDDDDLDSSCSGGKDEEKTRVGDFGKQRLQCCLVSDDVNLLVVVADDSRNATCPPRLGIRPFAIEKPVANTTAVAVILERCMIVMQV